MAGVGRVPKYTPPAPVAGIAALRTVVHLRINYLEVERLALRAIGSINLTLARRAFSICGLLLEQSRALTHIIGQRCVAFRHFHCRDRASIDRYALGSWWIGRRGRRSSDRVRVPTPGWISPDLPMVGASLGATSDPIPDDHGTNQRVAAAIRDLV